MKRTTALAAAAATTLALTASAAWAAGPSNEKVTICHATGSTTSVTPAGGGAAFQATRGVVISVPVRAALSHRQHGDVPFLDDNEVGADKKCLIAPNFNILDPNGHVIQDTRQELQAFINTLPAGELRDLLQQLLNRLFPTSG